MILRSAKDLVKHLRNVRPLSTTIAKEPAMTASTALSLIRSQPSHYFIASLAGQKYLLTPNDLLTVPRLRDVNVGDVISLTSIHELGSREYTLRAEGEGLVGEGLKVECQVVEHTKGAMEHIHKKKRRKGYERTIEHKQPYTRLRVGELQFKPHSN